MSPEPSRRQADNIPPGETPSDAYEAAVHALGRFAQHAAKLEYDFRMGERPPPASSVRTERIKLLATYLNTIGAGFAVTGVVGPIASYLYGTTAQTSRPASQLVGEVVLLIGFSVCLHLLARMVLGRLGS